jgi:hypothetical protein
MDALLNLLPRLSRLLLDAVYDLVGIVARFLHVLVRYLAELLHELLLQLRRALTDLLLEHVVQAHLASFVRVRVLSAYPPREIANAPKEHTYADVFTGFSQALRVPVQLALQRGAPERPKRTTGIEPATPQLV